MTTPPPPPAYDRAINMLLAVVIYAMVVLVMASIAGVL